MEDSRNPLTALAMERLTIATMDAICDGHGSVTVPVGDMQDVINSLSALLPPPPDAELREAVEYLSSGWGENSEASRFKAHVDTLIRAVQSPRLTPEQVKEAYLNGYEDGNEDGRALTGCRNVVEHTPRYDPDTAWAKSDTRAAFPEAFGKEG